jgi:hypothetical protein
MPPGSYTLRIWASDAQQWAIPVVIRSGQVAQAAIPGK